MKKLKDILFGVQIDSILGSTNVEVASVKFDSRAVEKNDLFVASSGGLQDGHNFIDAAIKNGAIAVVCEKRPEKVSEKIVWITTQNSREALAVLAANYYDNPSKKIQLVGVTGTNGKTTTASLLYALFEALGFSVGLLSTIAVKYNGIERSATHTTPDSMQINQALNEMVASGVAYCFMEVSSHGIDQERIKALHFAGGVFTNLSHDHLDYHQTFAAYRDVKKRFFDALSSQAFALVNADDKNAAYMLQNTAAKSYKYGLQNFADFQAKVLELSFSGMLLTVDQQELWTPLMGRFNASNLLAVYAVSQLLDVPKQEALAAASRLTNVKGRFQTYVTANKATVIVDYAHTPDALENVLKTITQIRTKNECLTTLIGCGGNRDQDKRPLMGKVATELSDKVIFTADNPRDEDPEMIIDQMEKGVPAEDFKKTLRITNREQAIKAACMDLKSGDVLLIAGKGHEAYQEIQGEKLPFDDYEIVENICKQLF